MPGSTDGFQLLFVCHANLCRSPLAEGLARRTLTETFGRAADDAVVSSAGTHAFVGSPMHPGSAQVLGEYGIDANGFTSRQLSPPILTGAGLVLTAAREQRAACVTMAPATNRRTFTIRQFIRYVQAAPADPRLVYGTVADRLRALVDAVNSIRHLVPTVPAAEDDLPDPIRQPIEAYRVCADELQRSLRTVIGVIAPA
jgi:protein-tyrosine phosphatase